MKYSRTFYSVIAVFSVILLHISCDRKKELSVRQLISDTHFKVEFSDVGYALDPLIPMGAYIMDDNSSIFCSNLKYQYKDSFYSLVDSSQINSLKYDSKGANIYAYFPYQDIENPNPEKHRVRVATDQQSLSNYQASDFMYAIAEHKTLSQKIDLQLSGKFAKIIINIKKKGLKESTEDIGVELVDIATSADINLKTGALSNLSDVSTIKLMKRSIPNSDFDYTVQGIAIPQEIQADKTVLRIVIGGKVYSHATRYEVSIEPAMQYVYNVTIDDFGMSVESEGRDRDRKGTVENLNSVSTHTYEVGDYYPMADDKLSAIGIVFRTSDDGLHGKVLSLDEALDLNWGPLGDTGAKSKVSGANNKAILERQDLSISEYRALSWCLKKGKGWYLPAINELVTIYEQKEILNRSLSPLLRSNSLGDGVYLSSTENNSANALVLYFGNGQRFQQDKNMESHVRAICDF